MSTDPWASLLQRRRAILKVRSGRFEAIEPIAGLEQSDCKVRSSGGSNTALVCRYVSLTGPTFGSCQNALEKKLGQPRPSAACAPGKGQAQHQPRKRGELWLSPLKAWAHHPLHPCQTAPGVNQTMTDLLNRVLLRCLPWSRLWLQITRRCIPDSAIYK
ncbi:hypothetical protein VTI28DRAFT_5796 [Corynascus sepedonium]